MLVPNLRQSLDKVFDAGVKSGDVVHSPTRLTEVIENDVHYEIGYAAALDKKPVPKEAGNPGAAKDPSADKDPFAPPYGKHSFVADVKAESGDEFVVLVRRSRLNHFRNSHVDETTLAE